MTSRRSNLALFASVFLVLPVGCSSDGSNDLGLGTTATTEATEVTTTTRAATTTIATVQESTTTAEAPTTVATEAPNTTAATTSTNIVDSVEAQVEAGFAAALAVRIQCGREPENCDFAAAVIPGSPADEITRQLIMEQIDNNQRTVAGQGEYKWRIDNIDAEGDVAFVTTCVFDTVIVFDIADLANPDDDIVVNDLRASTIIEWEMRLVDGRWGVYRTQRLERLEGGDLCGF